MMHSLLSWSRGLLLCLAPAAALSAQVHWQRHRDLSARALGAMAYDPVNARVLIFGGWSWPEVYDDTCTWTGAAWQALNPVHRPPALVGHAMAEDPARRRVVLFGGSLGSTPVGETWEWDGTDWTRLQPPVSPSPRVSHGLAWDPIARRMLLFGGRDTVGALGDTWHWDGGSWRLLAPATSPPPTAEAELVTDLLRRRIVLVDAAVQGHWEWDGSTWAWQQPPPVGGRNLVYDPQRQRCLLVATGLFSPGTWEFDGTAWLPIGGSAPAIGQVFGDVAWDAARQRAVWFGGLDGSTAVPVGDTWELSGTSWSRVAEPAGPVVVPHPAAYDPARGRVVVVDGSRTLEWDGSRWQTVTPALAPSYRWGAALAHDLRRGRTVLFGGWPQGVVGDTWSWDGMLWRQLTPAAFSPPGLAEHAMAYDAARDRVVVFGGWQANGAQSQDTWEFDGALWSLRAPTASPAARIRTALAWDPDRGRTLLFGGYDRVLGRVFNDLWEWDGSQWRAVAVGGALPPARQDPGLVYDRDRRRLVLAGGSDRNYSPLYDAWEFDGTAWLQRSVAQAPGHLPCPLVYDEARRLVVRASQSFWTYGPDTPADSVPFGAGCQGTAGTPALAARRGTGPWLDADLVLELTALPATTTVLLFTGSSRTRWGALQLPFALPAPGCSLLVSGQLASVAASLGGRAQVTLRVPNDPALLAARFYQQGLVVDAAANAAGFTMSNALENAIGSR